MTDDKSASESETKCKTKCKVVIIGAGMAGLSAANYLIQNGYTDFKILEARNRIGGRIISINMGAEKIQLGANWIHGILGNPMFEIAMSNGLIPIVNIPKPHKVVASTEDGKQVPFTILQEIYEAYVCFLRRCEEYFLCQYIPPPDIVSVGEHISLETKLYLNSVKDPKEKKLKELIFNCLLKRETCITGCHSMNEIDLLELGSYQELQGGNIVLPNGYSAILDPLSRFIPSEAIIMNSPVKSIHWKRKKPTTPPHQNPSDNLQTIEEEENYESDDSDKTVTDYNTKSSSPSKGGHNLHRTNVKIECENGTIYYCDHVICTIPLGVLKDTSSTLFNPELPQYKLDSIDSLLFGTVDKIFLEYDRPFLNAEISEIMLLWDEPIDADVVNQELESDLNYLKQNWYKKIYSFSKITDTLLLGWISGKEAEYMELLDSSEISERCTEILRKFLKDPYIPKPKKCICTSWKKQPYCRGSYTAMAIGASQDDIDNIAQPLYSNPHQSKPSILFSGEHTHSNFYSTVHGAYLSGRTAAKIILTPDSPQEIIMESDSSDLSAWIQGMTLQE